MLFVTAGRAELAAFPICRDPEPRRLYFIYCSVYFPHRHIKSRCWEYFPSARRRASNLTNNVILCFVDRASRYNHVKKNQLIRNLSLVYFVNLYMFWTYLGPSSGGTTVCTQQLVLSAKSNQDNRLSS
jgi:hypothetical protein